MPELPEVETVRSGLEKYILGKKITNAESFHPRAVKPGSIAPLAAVIGSKIKAVKRRGKFLWLELDRDFTLVAHLGMSGQLLVQPALAPLQSHLRAKLTLAGRFKSGSDQIRFIDQRTFGWLSVEEFIGEVPASVAHIAIDPFEEAFDLKKVITQIKSKRCAIKPAILNQEIVSGIGNIYADEALWRAKIHPEIPACDLTVRKIASLVDAATTVMAEAIAVGGTSFDALYVNVNGTSGFFETSLAAYGQEHQPCPRCGREIRRIAFGNRSSHFCPKCQVN